MLLFVPLCSVLALAVSGQLQHEDWVDPYDMLNYDVGSQTMKKSTKEGSDHTERTQCNSNVEDLKAQIEEYKKKITLISQQSACNPVFKRFFSRLLNDIQGLGLSSDFSEDFYDAKIRMSKQAMTEIQALLEGGDNSKNGALDNAISKILVDLKPHNYEAWKWRFEDTFGVELDVVLRILLSILVIMCIICTELWSHVSWFVQFRRLFAICFIVSIFWNWFYLYKIAFAEHQNNIVKMDSVNAKCTGVKKIDWSDSLKEWFRSTWTLQDDPCKKYYEVLMVNPILLVPPTKALSVTITTFITEPLKHFGQGISEFLRALLKDLPVTLQIPVLLTIVISIVVCLYGSVQAAFRHGIAAPFRRRDPQRDPPTPAVEQRQPQRIQDREHFAEEAGQQQGPGQPANDERLHNNQPKPNTPKKEHPRVLVNTLIAGDPQHSGDETDSALRERRPGTVKLLGASGDRVAAHAAPEKVEPTPSDSPSQSKAKPGTEGEESSRGEAALTPQQAQRQSTSPNDQDREDTTSTVSLTDVETIGAPVQESGSGPAE